MDQSHTAKCDVLIVCITDAALKHFQGLTGLKENVHLADTLAELEKQSLHKNWYLLGLQESPFTFFSHFLNLGCVEGTVHVVHMICTS